MRSLRDLEPGQQLECFGHRSSQWAKVFLGGEIVGTLTGAPEGFVAADGGWTIETQRGFLRFTEIVKDRAHDVEVARRERGYFGQSPFVFTSGLEYFFEPTRFW